MLNNGLKRPNKFYSREEKNRYSKSFHNRNRFSTDRFYIEGEEIIYLLSSIEKKLKLYQALFRKY